MVVHTALIAARGAHAVLVGEGEPSIDNWTFQLYYKVTSAILLTSAILISLNQFFGEPIQCDLPMGGVSQDTLKSYCWMYSTFTIPSEFQGSCARKAEKTEYGDEVFNSFYQWVSLCLVGQAILFFAPRALWLSLEGGLMKHLAKDATGKVVEDAEKKRDNLITTFNRHLHNKYDRYFTSFMGCEVLNLAILISQVFMTDRFLGHTFLYYGPSVWLYYSSPPEENKLAGRYNPMCEAFPRVASCTFYQYGAGGGQSSLNALCILALNVIIDKIYLLLWWWYLLLLVCGVIRLVERLLQLTFGSFRFWMMTLRMNRYFKDSEDTESLKEYLKNCSKGDWFVLYQMSKNMNRRLFFMFLTTLAKSPALQMRNVIPQIQVINAFKSSTKRKENGVSSPTWKVNITKKS